MNTRNLILTTLCLLSGGPLAVAEALAVKPNIVLILADDLGWRDAGCFGSTFYETPNIDRLAARGVRFTQAYAANPLCSPTRASILTGLYPARIGITAPACHMPQVQLEKRLAKGNPKHESAQRRQPHTAEAGILYARRGAARSGLRHGAFRQVAPWLQPAAKQARSYEPKDRGFDLDFPHTPRRRGPGGGYLAPWKFIKDPPLAAKPGTHIEDRMSEEAAKFIRAHKDQPFYVNYWAYSVHSPWNARRDYIDYFLPKADPKQSAAQPALRRDGARASTTAWATCWPRSTKRELPTTRSSCSSPTTAVGPTRPRPRTRKASRTCPPPAICRLRGGKASIYEGGTREPCIIVWPGQTKPGTTSDALLQSVDWYPTLLAMCGLKPHAGLKFDGLDQTPTLLGQEAGARPRLLPFPARQPQPGGQHPRLPARHVCAQGRLETHPLLRRQRRRQRPLRACTTSRTTWANRTTWLPRSPDMVRELNELIGGFLADTKAVVP